jgi:hypothetical protein
LLLLEIHAVSQVVEPVATLETVIRESILMDRVCPVVMDMHSADVVPFQQGVE